VSTPWPLVVVAALVGAEAALLAGSGAVELVGAVAGEPADALDAAVLGGLALLAASALALVARGLFRRRRWGRAPALLTQLLALPVAWGAVESRPLLGVPLLLAALATGVLLLSPTVGAALQD
jgi:hypothetical protein